jgi:hypothetical protein
MNDECGMMNTWYNLLLKLIIGNKMKKQIQNEVIKYGET